MENLKELLQATRIQTSILNGVEKKLLLKLAGHLPSWVTSDIMTVIGLFGAILIFFGYFLTTYNLAWIWLASFGLVVHWYGDSLDGTVARVRNKQRPVYGFYLDHMMDLVSEGLMLCGIGFSSLMHLSIALAILALYLMMTVSVMTNTHLKSEFRLTYAGMGPTEFRVIAIIANTVVFFVKPLRNLNVIIFGSAYTVFDLAGLAIILALLIIFFTTFHSDLKYYSKIDPAK